MPVANVAALEENDWFYIAIKSRISNPTDANRNAAASR
jgi:hypothetical protein